MFGRPSEVEFWGFVVHFQGGFLPPTLQVMRSPHLGNQGNKVVVGQAGWRVTCVPLNKGGGGARRHGALWVKLHSGTRTKSWFCIIITELNRCVCSY